MTDKCKLPTCNNELVHTEGRRPKEFCSPKCRTLFHNLKKVKGVGRGRPKGSKNKPTTSVAVLKEAIQNMGNTPVAVNTPKDEIGFDFSQDPFLNIEKHTKYPKKDRPSNIADMVEWDKKKKESDKKIREAWNKYKSLNK